MNFQTIATLKLMENGKVVYSIKLENLLTYDFVWDNKRLCTLHLVTSNLNIDDLNMLIAKPYDSYILIGVKKVFQDGREKIFGIPPRVFKFARIKGDYKTTDLTFKEAYDEQDDN